jgi:hypothetical protein
LHQVIRSLSQRNGPALLHGIDNSLALNRDNIEDMPLPIAFTPDSHSLFPDRRHEANAANAKKGRTAASP